MRNRIYLYIADNLIDVDDDSFILFNYTMEDLTNPTVVKNSFSQTITLPGTPNNNKIFGGIWRSDRKTQMSETLLTGAHFNPNKRVPFALYDEMNNILESGYVKLEKVSRDRGNISYDISLYGGMGSFFYALDVDDEGNKRTLADLIYTFHDGHQGVLVSIVNRYYVGSAWRYLADPDGYDWDGGDGSIWDIINFAPCYNGLPVDFDAKHAVVQKPYDNVPSYVYIDGVQWSTKSDATSLLVTMSNDHTEWEMRDLRSYLQRPIISVRKIVDAVCNPKNNGGYTVNLDLDFFNEDNAIYWNGWITLPLVATKHRNDYNALVDVLKSTSSPCEYLLSLVKMCGLVVMCDNGSKTIDIMTRNNFYYKYRNDIIDLTDRVSGEVQITPMVADTKFYQLGSNGLGEYVKSYEEQYGIGYAIQRINTGYEFNKDVKILTDGVVLNNAADVYERNRLFTSNNLYRGESGGHMEGWILPNFESVKMQVWATVDNEEQSQDIDIVNSFVYAIYPDNSVYPYQDWLPKLQFHEADNKAVDGSNVLILFNGIRNVPEYNSYQSKFYRLTDDHADMDILNGGSPCWNLTEDYVKLTFLPVFRRVYANPGTGDKLFVQATAEWGVPKERAVNDLDQTFPNTLYTHWWKEYLMDRYDVDTRVIRCNVDLRGMTVGQELLRRFFWFDGSYWVLNKIMNHSMTTYDLTECEFVKVKDRINYYQGQIVF